MKVLIVGGGIAGTTLGFTLRKAGVDVVVAEAAPERADTGGAFLYLAPNGINALRAAGLGDVPAATGGFEQSGLEFFNARGRRIAVVSGDDDLARYGARGIVMRRALLHAGLTERARAAGVPFLHDARLTGLRERENGMTAEFADGRTIDADVVIGADGIWSKVRRLTWPDAASPRYTGIVDCGGWARIDLPDTTRQQMWFGKRAFFGYTVKDSLAYWFANVPRADEPARGELDDPTAWFTAVRELFADDTGPVRAILEAADRAVGAWPLYDLPTPARWHTGRVCLVGDAAHAVNPSTGQGASLAIEDAVVLAGLLAGASRPSEAFAAFALERRARAEKIVRFGRQIGTRKVSSAASSFFRDLSLRFFLRLGSGATAEQYSYRVPQAEPVR